MLRYYLSIIFIATAVVAATNAIFHAALGFSAGYLVIFTLLFVAFAFLTDAVVACFMRLLPKNIFSFERRRFTVSDKEKRRYDKLKIKAWKDKIPETGALLKIFDKTKIENPDDPVYLAVFLRETCFAELMHCYSLIIPAWIFFLAPDVLKWTVALPVFAVNFLLQLPPIAVQRYNRHRLAKLYSFQRRKEARESAKAAATDLADRAEDAASA